MFKNNLTISLVICLIGFFSGVVILFYNAAKLQEATTWAFYIATAISVSSNLTALSIAWSFKEKLSTFSKILTFLHLIIFLYILVGVSVISYSYID